MSLIAALLACQSTGTPPLAPQVGHVYEVEIIGASAPISYSVEFVDCSSFP